jgi:hypothetical protein
MNPSEFIEGRIAEMVDEVSAYMRQERDMYVRHSEPLATPLKKPIQDFFPRDLMGGLKTITLAGGARISAAAVLRRSKSDERRQVS